MSIKNYSIFAALTNSTATQKFMKPNEGHKVWFTRLTYWRSLPTVIGHELVAADYGQSLTLPEALAYKEAVLRDLQLTDVLVEDHDYLYLSTYCRDGRGLPNSTVQPSKEEIFMHQRDIFPVQLEILKWLQKEYPKKQVPGTDPYPKLRHLQKLATELVIDPPEEMAALRGYLKAGVDAGCFVVWGRSPTKNEQKKIELLIMTIYVFLLTVHHTKSYDGTHRAIYLDKDLLGNDVWLDAIREAEIMRRTHCTRVRIPQGFGLLHRVHF